MIHGFKVASTIYSEKGTDHNAEAEREFRYCTAIALRHPYKAVLTFFLWLLVVLIRISSFTLEEPKE